MPSSSSFHVENFCFIVGMEGLQLLDKKAMLEYNFHMVARLATCAAYRNDYEYVLSLEERLYSLQMNRLQMILPKAWRR